MTTLSAPSLDGIERWPGLTRLHLAADAGSPFAAAELRHLVALPELVELEIDLDQLSGLAELRLPPLPQIRSLCLRAEVQNHIDFGEIRAVFPNLTTFSAQLEHRSVMTLEADVSALRAVPDSNVTIAASGRVRLTGEKELPGESRVHIDSTTPPVAKKPRFRLWKTP